LIKHLLQVVRPDHFALSSDRVSGAIRLDELAQRFLLVEVPPSDAEERTLIVGSDPEVKRHAPIPAFAGR
jgi:hypothetical protein